MFCPNCKASVGDKDCFCPKCGTDMLAPKLRTQAAGVPVAPPVVGLEADQGVRVAQTRVPIVEGGHKYVGLTKAAEVMIRSAAVIRILSYVLGILSAVSIFLYLREKPVIGVMLGIVAGLVVALLGWQISLSQTVRGELMYVVMDLEESLRRRG